METSPASDVTMRPFVIRVSVGGPTPWIVAMVWCVDVWSALSMANCSMAFGHTKVVEAWSSIIARPSMDWFDFGYRRRTGHVRL